MPSIRSRPEGPKKGGIKFIWTSSPPPPSPHVATPAKVSTAPIEKSMCNIEFIFVLLFVLFYYKTSDNLIVKKR